MYITTELAGYEGKVYTDFDIDCLYRIVYTKLNYTVGRIRSHIEKGMMMLVRNPSDLGAVIQQARLNRKLSQAALAKKVGLHQPKVSEIERGKSGVNLDTIMRVLAALQLSINIVDGTSADQQPKVIDAGEPGYDDDFDLDAIADTGIKK